MMGIAASLAMAAGCTKKATEPAVLQAENQTIMSTPVRAMPKATVFQMNGNYANNVAVTLNADGSFAYYPDPHDIGEYSKPIDLGNGWWLNRQGIGANSQFTKYTFAEYSKLDKVPSPDELKAAIIPGARVIAMEQTDIPASDALNRLPDLKAFVQTLSSPVK